MSSAKHAIAILLTLTALTAAGEDAPSGLSVVNAFEYPPGVCRAIIENAGSGTADLSQFALVNEHGAPIPVLWSVVEPPRVASGQRAYLTYRLEPGKEALTGVLERHVLDASGVRCSYEAPAPPPLAVTYLVFDDATGTVYVYLRNPGSEPRSVARVDLDGRPVEFEGPVDVEAGNMNLIVGQWSEPDTMETGAPWCCVKATDSTGDSVCLPARLLRPEQTPRIPRKDLEPTFRCISHRHGPPRDAGKVGVDVLLASAGTVRTLAFCNVDLVNDAPANFGSMYERCRTEPQPAYDRECWAGNHIAPVLACALRTKTYTEPGTFYPILLMEFIHRTDRPPFPVPSFRDVAYTCFAGGAKGATLWDTYKRGLPEDSMYPLVHVLKELERLHPLISIAEPVPWTETSERAWCTSHLLLCGDQGLLLILLPIRDGGERQDAVVRLRIPDERRKPIPAGEEIGGQHETLTLESGPEGLSAAVVRGSQTRVFFIPASGKARVTP